MPKRFFSIVGYLGDFRLCDAGLWFARTRIEETLASRDEMFDGPYFGAVVGEREPVRSIALDRLNQPGVLNPCADGDLYLISSPKPADFAARITRMRTMLRGRRACVLACAVRGREEEIEKIPGIRLLSPA